MKKFFILLFIPVMIISCKKARNNKCDPPELNCADIMCITHNYTFGFRIVDKETGADLVFGSNPRYTTSDIKLYSDASATIPIPLFVDSPNKAIRTSFARPKMYMTLGAGSPIMLDAEFAAVACCASRVQSLKVAGQSICTCCSDVILIPDN
jgi:hypothetical protein